MRVVIADSDERGKKADPNSPGYYECTWIYHGFGIKDTTKDIDIAVSDDYYEYLLKNYNCKFERINEYGKKVYFIHDIINFSSTYYKNNRLIIEEIPIQTANDILELKLFLKREKDYKDIELIKEYINEQE